MFEERLPGVKVEATAASSIGELSMPPQSNHETDSLPQDVATGHESASARRTWKAQFRDAGRGVSNAIHGERSFRVHFVAAISVFVAAGVLRVSTVEWAVLLLCIGVVFAGETFNSSIESMAKAITREQHPDVG